MFRWFAYHSKLMTLYVRCYCRRTTYPTTVAANPRRRNQFALGFSDGDVLVVETRVETGEEINYESAEGVVNDESEDGLRVEEQDKMAHCGCFDHLSSLISFLMSPYRAGCLLLAIWPSLVCRSSETLEEALREK